jgi:hypothetical protein
MRRGVCGAGFAPLSLCVILFASAPGDGQQNVLDLRLLEANEEGDVTYQNFLYSRTVGDSKLSFEAFALFLPQLDYEELGLGVGYRAFRLGQVAVSFLAYVASAADDDYFEPALLLLDSEGRLTGSFLLLRYVPLGNDGSDQWLIDPAEIQYRVAGPVSLGVSAYLYRPEGGSWLSKIGPKISIADRLGATEVAAREVNQGGGIEIQMRRIFVF